MLVKDLLPGPAHGNPLEMAPMAGGGILFSAEHLIAGRELWISDGTGTGTNLLADVYQSPGTVGANPRSLVDRYGVPALEAACRRALGFELVNVHRLERIVLRGLDRDEADAPSAGGR